MNVGVRNPLHVLFKLEARLAAIERPRQGQRCKQRDPRNAQREPLYVAVAVGKERQQQSARQRQKRDDGEDVVIDEVHRTPLHTMNAMTTAAPAATHPAYDRMLPDCMWRSPSEISLAPSALASTPPSISATSTPL